MLLMFFMANTSLKWQGQNRNQWKAATSTRNHINLKEEDNSPQYRYFLIEPPFIATLPRLFIHSNGYS